MFCDHHEKARLLRTKKRQEAIARSKKGSGHRWEPIRITENQRAWVNWLGLEERDLRPDLIRPARRGVTPIAFPSGLAGWVDLHHARMPGIGVAGQWGKGRGEGSPNLG